MSQQTTATAAAPRPALLTRNKVGLVILGLLGLSDFTSLGFDTPDGEVGPPDAILYLDVALGVVTVIAVVVALVQRRRGAVRLAAGARVLSVLTAMPAFFAGVAPVVVALVAVVLVITVVGIILALSPGRGTTPVTD